MGNEGLTEFITEIFRVDDGRRTRIGRVDVLFESNVSTHVFTWEKVAALQLSHVPTDAAIKIEES